MRRLLFVLVLPLVLAASLSGCMSTPPTATPSRAEGSSAARPSASAPATSASAPASESSGEGLGPSSGTITFTGTVSGSMVISASGCPEQLAQLAVTIDGEDKTFSGIISADDFTFVGPDSSGYALASKAAKPKVSGKTFTVENAKLVGIFDDGDSVVATGSVTCP